MNTICVGPKLINCGCFLRHVERVAGGDPGAAPGDVQPAARGDGPRAGGGGTGSQPHR